MLGGRDPVGYGTWAFYPWSGRLVHVLPREESRFVRTDRNRNKITREEQQVLLGKRVAVIGLSVGNSAALTAAMEGVGGRFRLADFDRLGLSNLNRLRAGVHDLGVEKTVLCARQLFELDPYLDVEIWRACLREQARERGIPVLMDTNDRGLPVYQRVYGSPVLTRLEEVRQQRDVHRPGHPARRAREVVRSGGGQAAVRARVRAARHPPHAGLLARPHHLRGGRAPLARAGVAAGVRDHGRCRAQPKLMPGSSGSEMLGSGSGSGIVIPGLPVEGWVDVPGFDVGGAEVPGVTD